MIRIIPRLDIKGPNLVKGIQLEGLRVLGKPSDFAKAYYEGGADEIVFQDVVASLYGRNSLTKIIEETAAQVFIPITVGGGLRSIQDIQKVLNVGADKVMINTAAINNPNLISEVANKFGSSTIVVAIEAIKQKNGEYLVFTDNGREYTGKNVVEWAIEAQNKGAGEILCTSVDKDGTKEGFDINLLRNISNELKIPLIAHGGCGVVDDCKILLEESKVDAVSIASAFHYRLIRENIHLNIDVDEGNQEFKKTGLSKLKYDGFSISELKIYLDNLGYDIRI